MLVDALDDKEITLQEFAEAVQPLTSEALQVIATVLAADPDRESGPRVWAARRLCAELAAATRCLS